MPDYKDILKKGKASSAAPRTNHVARPLNTLQDPSSFGPPPIRRVGTESPGIPSPPPSRPSSVAAVPEPSEPLAPPKPYRVDTSGLSTSHLPPPPTRRDSPVHPPPYTGTTAKPTPPKLPPRLSPRNPPAPTSTSAPTSPPPSSNLLNQSSLTRLSAAGISVPSLGIGTGTAQPKSPPGPPPQRSPVNDLSSRFARLSTSSQPAETTAPEQGTTFEEKRAALRTATAFQQDPRSVSFSDARAAASTANNFRQRHGEQVAAGVRGANSLHDKYGGRLNLNQGEGGGSGSGNGSVGQAVSGVAALAKKPPPPPPPKKPAGFRTRDGDPPPVPLATRPQF
ncbi:hypothetical protein OQA88_7611 [Cercophora sp. LCS_1]